MPWFKVDDGFWSHPKVIDLTPEAGWLWLRAGCYASQHLTDGLVKFSTLRMLGAESLDADALVQAGLWDSKPDGYEFHDWERYQPPSSTSKAKRDELSQKRAEAGRKGANSRWQNEKQDDSNTDGKLLSGGDGKSIAPSRPVPSRPQTPKGPPKAVVESEFERAYSEWPKKAERAKSLEKFKTLVKNMDMSVLVADIIRFGKSYARSTEPRFVPALVVWLNGSRWEDQLPDANTKALYVTHTPAPDGEQYAVDALDAF